MSQLQKVCSVIQNTTDHVILKFGTNVYLELDASGVKISAPSVTFNCSNVIANGNIQSKSGFTGSFAVPGGPVVSVEKGLIAGISEL